MQRIILLFTLLFLSLVQISCQSSDKKSILVIAVDELPMSKVNCNQEQEGMNHSGIQILCKESVRYTHAFTTSPLSVPALASILTGRYPLQHKVHHNGAPSLEPEMVLASEIALNKNYHTGFFSGGAPVLHRAGLGQGFEVFDDNFKPQVHLLFRPFKKSAEQFLHWINSEVTSGSFFAMMYVPDLSFTNQVTTNKLGDVRNQSFESQQDELDEGLFDLFQALKKQNRWEKTTVILVGLNGHISEPRNDELSNTNLHAEKTQVALLIKPTQDRKRDESIHWKIDENVSITDLGSTLFDLLGKSLPTNVDDDFPVYSLLSTLKSPSFKVADDRPLLLESGWALWTKTGKLKVASIADHILFINSQPPQVYNTLLDRFEVNPLPLNLESASSITNTLNDIFKANELDPFLETNEELKAKMGLPYDRWTKLGQEAFLLIDLKRLLKKYPQSEDLINWTAQFSLLQRDWLTLKELGKKSGNRNWEYIADRNLNLKTAKTEDPCFKLINANNIETAGIRKCDDSLFLELVNWISAEESENNKELQKKRFEYSFRNLLLDQEVQRFNIGLGLIWDSQIESTLVPSKTQLALNLPELAKFKHQITRALLTSKDEEE